jgi:hypothetical protein
LFKPIAPYNDPTAVLSAAGRSLESFASKPALSTWDQLFTATSQQLADDAGMNVKERKYLLWLLEKYR